VRKYLKFPVGHPVIHVGESYQIEKPFTERGIDKMLYSNSPENLPSRIALSLQRQAVLPACVGREPPSATRMANALTKQWFINEVRLAVQKD